MADALLELRNKSVFTFFMLNSIFVLLIFFLELKKKTLSIKWPFGDKDLDLEPIGFVFVAFFAIILLIQFVAMLFHRFATLSQILVSTDLNISTPCTPKNIDSVRQEASVTKGGVGLVRALQQKKLFEGKAPGTCIVRILSFILSY
jgi:chitin synthase